LQDWKTSNDKPAYEYVRLLTKYYTKSFYLSTQLLPKKKRRAVYALYGFCRYADNLIDNPTHRSDSELLQEIDCFTGEVKTAFRTGESEHPAILPMIHTLKEYGVPVKYPLELLKGVQMDIINKRYPSFDDLYLFCYRVAGVVGLMMTYVLGYHDKTAFHFAEKLGVAMQLANILRDVQEDKNMGRIYIPLKELRQHGNSENDILNDRMTDDVQRLMKFQVNRAHSYFEEGDQGISLLSPDSRFAIYSASKIYRGILKKIEARGYNPFLGRVYVSQRGKIAILLKEFLVTRLIASKQSYSRSTT
jgi:15-cis-phytoene synthase